MRYNSLMTKMTKIEIRPGVDVKLARGQKKLPIIRPYYQPFFFAALPANILNAVLAAVFYHYLPPVIPLWGSVLERADRLAPRIMIFLLPIIASIINIIHAGVIYFGRKSEVTLLRIFGFFTVFIQLLLLAVLLRIILVLMPLGRT